MSHIIAIIRINDTFGLFTKAAQWAESAFPLNWHFERHQINYESDLWLHNRNLMKALFRRLRRFYSLQTEADVVAKVIRSSRWLGFSPSRRDSYRHRHSEHVAYISFIFLSSPTDGTAERNPSYLLPWVPLFGVRMYSNAKPKRQLLTTRRRRRTGREKFYDFFLSSSRRNVSSGRQKLLCCHVDGEKLCGPYLAATTARRRDEKLLLSLRTLFIDLSL